MEESDSGENSENSRQPPKRDGDKDQYGQPMPKRAAPLDSEPTQVPSAAGPANAENKVTFSMRRLFGAIEQGLGQSMVDLARLFARNEEALRNSVRNLRNTLQLHHGHMDPRMEEFLEALGPGLHQYPNIQRASIPLITIDQNSIPRVPDQSTSELPTAVAVDSNTSIMSERSAKEILRLLGRILETVAQLGDALDARQWQSTTAKVDGNEVARTLSEVLFEVGEHLQYTYRSNLDELAVSLESRLTPWKLRMETVISKLKGATTEQSPEEARSLILQLFPRLIYPNILQPESRYLMVISDRELRAEEPQRVFGPRPAPEVSQPSSTLNSAENTLLLRYGSEEFINGQRTTRIDYIVQGISFAVYEAFSSRGWVHPTGTEGQFIRWLEFDVRQFEEGTVVYRIEERSRSTTEEIQLEGTQYAVVVSGILKTCEEKPVNSTESGQRIEFVFIFPSHLSRKHINDVGIRDGIIKIQFAK